jgi:hypothetical protein
VIELPVTIDREGAPTRDRCSRAYSARCPCRQLAEGHLPAARSGCAFSEDALILFMSVGSIVARMVGPEGLHDAMEALRLAVEMDGIDRPGLSPSIN